MRADWNFHNKIKQVQTSSDKFSQFQIRLKEQISEFPKGFLWMKNTSLVTLKNIFKAIGADPNFPNTGLPKQDQSSSQQIQQNSQIL